MPKQWIKPLLIGAILLLIAGIVLVAVLAGNDEEHTRKNEREIVSVKENSEYRYNLYNDGSAGILGYLGGNKIITVPEQIDGATVTDIENSAFESSSLTGIVLPETITRIGDRAFFGCEVLTSLTVPKTVKTVGKDAFIIVKNGAHSFIPWVYSREGSFVIIGDGILIAYIGTAPKDMKIPEEVRHICRFYFSGPSITSLTLPKKLRSIGDSAFEDFSAITSIKLPSTLTEIGNRAFYNCKSLTELSIPASCKIVADEAFACCPKIKTVKIEGAEIIGKEAFAYCMSLSSVTLPPKGLIIIAERAFTDCSNLTDIVIPNSVTTLGTGALHATGWMNERKDQTYVITDNGMLVGYNGPGGQITVEDSAIEIVVDAFCGRTDITGVILGNSVKKISDGAFQNCTALQAVVASKYLETVGKSAFNGCTSLTQVDLLDGVRTIGDNAFEGCTSLVYIDLPKNLKAIPAGCFIGCNALVEITLPESLTIVKSNAFNMCPLEKINYSGTNKQKEKIKIEEGNAVFSTIFNS